ncbi:clan AA aspartic protease [Ectothiorhodospiraceae bacterium 2226]|nr:clan AA aspartic protease [Ectothiorhodospiraceae bacterium 2226]
MHDKGLSTFYVNGAIQGVGDVEFMVDTGSGYMTINERSLEQLQSSGNAEYVRELTGVLADGSRKVVPVYRLEAVTLGDNCVVRNVEAAVFPGDTRHILGLSVLRRTAPFTFSTEPPSLVLSHCMDTPATTAQAN